MSTQEPRSNSESDWKKLTWEAFGFDDKRRRVFLERFELGPADAASADKFQRLIIVPNVVRLVEDFYQRLMTQEPIAAILERDSVTPAFFRGMTRYLLTLGVDFESTRYFDQRLRAGLSYAGIGIPLGLFQCGFSILQRLLLDVMQKDPRLTADEKLELTAYTLKIFAFDMAIVTETYYQNRVDRLESMVTALRGERQVLLERVKRDPLTSLVNREHMFKLLDSRHYAVRQHDTQLSIVMADIDRFKSVNDTYGHPFGDLVLQALARRMASALRGADVLGRYGGEEFLIILSDTGLDQAKMVAERVRRAVEEAPFRIEGEELRLTISQGVAEALSDEKPEELIARADAALYAAKHGGRNRVMADTARNQLFPSPELEAWHRSAG